MVFHSTALMKGCSPFVRTETDEQLFLEHLHRFLGLVKEEGVVCAPLSEDARLPSTRSAKVGVDIGYAKCHEYLRAGSA